jgi:hypothetical protein
MHSDRLIGEVCSFFPDKNFGFIKTEKEENYFFYQSELNFQADFKEGLILKRYEALIGDMVTFVLRPNFRPDDPPIAAGLVRMTNFYRLKMIKMATEKEFLVGTLKKRGNSFFVVHRESGAWVRVSVSSCHKKPEEWMEERIDFWVKFKINGPKEEEKVCAYLLDLPLRNKINLILSKIENKETVNGKVVHRSNAGITVVLRDSYINGNLSIKTALNEEEKSYFNQVKVGDEISAFPLNLDLEKGIVKLDFFRPAAEINADDENSTEPSDFSAEN